MNNLYFGFGVHGHQPVGNCEKVFEESFQKSYEPFFREISDFPKIFINVHISGPLMEWLEKNRPEFIELIAGMVKKDQAEILGGPFYEPILTLIPEKDIIEQIVQYSEYLADKFGTHPRGLWLPERVWEPYLAKPIAMAGMEYVLVDDMHFHLAGWMDDKLHGYFITEHEGFKLKIIPIIEKLRYRMPYKEPQVVLEYLKKMGEASGGGIRVMMDDVEKFGLWPKSYDSVYGEKWLARFLQQLCEEQKAGKILTTKFSSYLDKFPSDGNIYLPAASYSEMGRWSLPPDSGALFSPVLDEIKAAAEGEEKPWMPFVSGGFFRNMLSKYPESNLMHKKMLKLSRAIDFFRAHPDFSRMQKHLFKAQCNCAYWHGVFGGIYERHLRAAIFHELLECEKIYFKLASHGNIITDIDDTVFYGQKELQITTGDFSVHLHPTLGASVSEFSEFKSCHNIGFVIRRRPEFYHKSAKNPPEAENGLPKPLNISVSALKSELKKGIVYDWYDRFSFITHFFHRSTQLSDFAACAYGEQGDFVNQPFSYDLDSSAGRVIFERSGHIWQGSEFLKVLVVKSFEFVPAAGASSALKFHQTVENNSSRAIKLQPGIELNLSPSHPETARFIIDGKQISCSGLFSGASGGGEVLLQDEFYGLKIKFVFSTKTKIWIFPVDTVCRLENTFEKMFQGTSLTFYEEIELSPGGRYEQAIDVINGGGS